MPNVILNPDAQRLAAQLATPGGEAIFPTVYCVPCKGTGVQRDHAGEFECEECVGGLVRCATCHELPAEKPDHIGLPICPVCTVRENIQAAYGELRGAMDDTIPWYRFRRARVALEEFTRIAKDEIAALEKLERTKIATS